jgi:hypothetical protein
MTIVATTLYVSLGAQPGPRTRVTKSGIAYDVQGQGPVVVLLTGANLDLRMWAREAAPCSLLYSPSTISRRPNSPRTQCGSQCGWLPSTKSTVISSVPSTP